MTATDLVRKTITLRVSAELHAALHAVCAASGISVTKMVNEALTVKVTQMLEDPSLLAQIEERAREQMIVLASLKNFRTPVV